MRNRSLSVIGAIAAGMLVLTAFSGAALAQDGESAVESDQSSPPGRVAQLSFAEGSVSLEPAGTSSWTSAVLNRPLTLGDKLWTDENSRAELDIGDAVIRLGSTTGFSFLNLDDQTAQMQVTAGTVIVHVRTLSSGEQDEIDTPNLALTLQQPGTYRIEVSDTGDTTIVKVDDGAALATGGGQSYPLTAQQSVTFTGADTVNADYATLGAPDTLDDWSMQRDQETQQQAAVAQQYVPPDMVGADRLGSYGSWESTPDWGYAWFPAVAVGWAPYSLGRWVWVSPWGWTWVDEEPWGFAPFHYGRWGYWHRRWCWIPGPRRVHPVYAPALVGWVGGRHGDVSVTTGAHVGWFPLGPRDVYVPGYHVSPRYVREINVTNIRTVNTTYITNVYEGRAGNIRYANSDVPGAVTAVPRNVFTSAQPVRPHRVILPHQGGMGLRATTAAPPIMPVRQSVLGAGAGRVVRTPPRAIVDRPVVARLTPPRAPVSFAREQAAIRANGGRPLPIGQLERMRPNTPAAPVRLARPPAASRPGLELRTAPENRRPTMAPGMSARERLLQQPTLPPGRPQRNDRPVWAQGRPTAPTAPVERPRPQTFAPQQRPVPQRQAPLEWRTPAEHPAAPSHQTPAQRFAPPARQIPQERFAPPQRQLPEQRFSPPAREPAPQRFAPPERQVPQQRFAPPPDRQPPQQHFAPPVRQMPEQRFAPSERPIPQQRFAPPREEAPREPVRAPAPRPARERPPARSEGRPPMAAHPGLERRLSLVADSAGQSPPPMYRAQASTVRYSRPPDSGQAADSSYRPPVTPPPMYRPVSGGGSAGRRIPLESAPLAIDRRGSVG